MTKEEKQLIIKDICSMLPYGVKFESYDNIPIVEYCVCDNVFIHEQGYAIIELLDKDSNGNTLASTSINLTTVSRLPKPYLRPISSMTEEEKKIMRSYGFELIPYDTGYTGFANIENCIDEVSFRFMEEFLNARRFDYRGLIEKGLAIEAPEGMYKTDQI